MKSHRIPLLFTVFLSLATSFTGHAFYSEETGKIRDYGHGYPHLDPSVVPGETMYSTSTWFDSNSLSLLTSEVSPAPDGTGTSTRYEFSVDAWTSFSAGDYYVYDELETLILHISRTFSAPVGVFNWTLSFAGDFGSSSSTSNASTTPELFNLPMLTSAGPVYMEFTPGEFSYFGYVQGAWGSIDGGIPGTTLDPSTVLDGLESGSVKADGNFLAIWFGANVPSGEFINATFSGDSVADVPDSSSTAILLFSGILGLACIRSVSLRRR